jgi:hypothetical protein
VAGSGDQASSGKDDDVVAQARAAGALQQQLVDLLALGVAAMQARWTLRGPASAPARPILRTFERVVQQFADDLAAWIGERGQLPNGTLPAQLIAIVPSRVPGWWPAREAAAQLAADTRIVAAATMGRSQRLRLPEPELAHVLESQARVLTAHSESMQAF